jgi:hypothetical protein
MRKNPYVLSLGYFLIFCAVFILIFMAIATYTATTEWRDLFSLGQFLVELCLIPIAIVGFMVTIAELRKAQQIASLDLYWRIGKDEFSQVSTTNRPGSSNYVTNSLVLINKGNAPSIHFQITLEYPLSCGRARMQLTDWKHTSHQVHEFIFNSATQYISYPGNYVELGNINFPDKVILPDKCVIHYYISSDNGEYKEGELTFQFQDSN